MPDMGRREPQCRSVTKGQVYGTVDPERVIIPIFGGHASAKDSKIRLVSDDVDRAARGVAPVKGALRTIENLDAIDVIEEAGGRGGAANVDVVDVEGDSSIRKSIGGKVADAAQIE